MQILVSINTIQNDCKVFPFFLMLMAIFLHQSNVVFGVNISFADFFCFISILLLAMYNQINIPVGPFVFFMLVAILTLITSTFYMPFLASIIAMPVSIIGDFVKLVAMFLYFILGFNMMRYAILMGVIKVYSYFGVFVGIIGILLTFVPFSFFRDILFFAGTRYRGLMIDPNYFSVLFITAIVYFTRTPSISGVKRIFILLLAAVAVLVTGSKTGTITLFCYLLFRMVEYSLLSVKRLKTVIIQLITIIFIILFAPIMLNALAAFQEVLIAYNGGLERVLQLFLDFSSAVSENGSGRDRTWVVALNIIYLSPFAGIGIGSFTNIAENLFDYDNVAHNTFLQLGAEWGLIFALVLFAYISFQLIYVTGQREKFDPTVVIIRDVIIILLIGSIAISLNNARVLWLFLGALTAAIQKARNKKVGGV